MSISDVDTPELWVAGFVFVALALAAQFEGVVLVNFGTMGVDQSIPAAVAVVGTMLGLWWLDNE
ncbi:hypothetical protein E6P09_02710 [Haloferax mediterranei ATCC 33500]|uniref:Uncharacterized protein n=1 Tax=Haloferax mediterranei (strain ATCC 33500 / DSM 1411 / JCM 8866 / NBRC 14739 / NCIMB 2177 / R-4) TaxID=523841 RepID=I3R8R0_HALMT|nr:hypothetical protein [Haloferax mediterranei]AFK20620.2 hypothetical protein HFX_2956 [Haloferax mediterranei ATCC 33500]AHZ22896.1 hypothetical protein BM92_09695 [Haloferax mediterranei ATCC 33500]EMA03061.1 hypothetical protein C439_10770 [Haloferax mediterranei ATCC 33500]MDX5987758.1 hypothetical protein [Haloferax mediterranei ATCC 33500]QCQ74237.1 hypothetical protein E6P09_02710 [Haloferax mediterranei ATCC 33500]